MIDIPNAAKTLFLKDTTLKNLKISFPFEDHDNFSNTNIVYETLRINDSICSEDYLKYGLYEKKKISFETVGINDISGKIIDASISFKDRNDSEPLTITVSGTPGSNGEAKITKTVNLFLEEGEYVLKVPTIPEFLQTEMTRTVAYIDDGGGFSEEIYEDNPEFQISQWSDSNVRISFEFYISGTVGKKYSYDFVLESTDGKPIIDTDDDGYVIPLGRFKVDSAKLKSTSYERREIIAYDEIIDVNQYFDSPIVYFLKNSKWYNTSVPILTMLDFVEDSLFGNVFEKTKRNTYPDSNVVLYESPKTWYTHSQNYLFRVKGQKLEYNNSDIAISTTRQLVFKNIDIHIGGIGSKREDFNNQFENGIDYLVDNSYISDVDDYDHELRDYIYPLIYEYRPSSFYTSTTKLPEADVVKKIMKTDGTYHTGTYYESIKVSSTSRINSSKTIVMIPKIIEFGYYSGSTFVSVYDMAYLNGNAEEFQDSRSKIRLIESYSATSKYGVTDINDDSATEEILRSSIDDKYYKDFIINRATSTTTTFTDATTRTDYGSTDNLFDGLTSEEVAKNIAEIIAGYIKNVNGIPTLVKAGKDSFSLEKNMATEVECDNSKYCSYNAVHLITLDVSTLEEKEYFNGILRYRYDTYRYYDLTDNQILRKMTTGVSWMNELFYKYFFWDASRSIYLNYHEMDAECVGMPWIEPGDECSMWNGYMYYVLTRELRGLQRITDNFISK